MAVVPELEVTVKLHVEVSPDVRIEPLEPGVTYLVTVPAHTPSDVLKDMADSLKRMMRWSDAPPLFVFTRGDTTVEPLPPDFAPWCPRCRAECDRTIMQP